jgi:diacylglycerol kinase (ATP)
MEIHRYGYRDAMSNPAPIAVVAHRKKSLDGGLDELRTALADEGAQDVLWYEVSKSRKAPKKVRKAVKAGADTVFVWGGDGMVQRCVDALAGTGTTVAIVPAGTANLLASNLGIPDDLREAVRLGFHGERRPLDLGRLNGEHFAVMAGAGFDGELIAGADRELKGRLGKLSYVWAGLRHVNGAAPRVKVRVDGTKWFDGKASCVLLGNVGTITGGIQAFDDAKPDDGWLEVGVSTAQGAVQWARTLGRMAAGRSDRSPFVRVTRAKTIDVKFATPTTYELDGGERKPITRLKATVVPNAITVCVPGS